jgi:hypothetical protein
MLLHPSAADQHVRRWATLRSQPRNSPVMVARIGAEIVQRQERAERSGDSVADNWFDLVVDAGWLPMARKAVTSCGTLLWRS